MKAVICAVVAVGVFLAYCDLIQAQDQSISTGVQVLPATAAGPDCSVVSSVTLIGGANVTCAASVANCSMVNFINGSVSVTCAAYGITDPNLSTTVATTLKPAAGVTNKTSSAVSPIVRCNNSFWWLSTLVSAGIVMIMTSAVGSQQVSSAAVHDGSSW